MNSTLLSVCAKIFKYMFVNAWTCSGMTQYKQSQLAGPRGRRRLLCHFNPCSYLFNFTYIVYSKKYLFINKK